MENSGDIHRWLSNINSIAVVAEDKAEIALCITVQFKILLFLMDFQSLELLLRIQY